MTVTTKPVQELVATYNESLTHFIASKKDVSRIKNLRPSQLPFCPPGFFVRHASYGKIQVQDMRSAFYTSVGQAVHTTVQTYLAYSGKFLASWHCRQCNTWHRVSTKNECCEFPCAYHEIEIRYKGIIGHIDAVFKDRYGKFWIVDFKTTSVKGAPTKLLKPGVDYVEQVEAYALLLWLQYGIKVAGVMLMFIKRDNPKEPIVWSLELGEKDFIRIKNKLVSYKRRHKQVLAIRTLEEALTLIEYGKCKNPWCSTCKSSVPLQNQITKAFRLGNKKGFLPLKDL